VVWGCSNNSLSQFHKVKEALDKIELVVVIDPFPTTVASSSDRAEGVYLLPACSQFETSGSISATNRSVQWRYQVIEPIFESRPDYDIIMDLAKRLGLYDKFAKNIKNIPDDITKEINLGALSIGYIGQTPERIRKHTDNWGTFDIATLKARDESPCKGEYYGLPWPCWNTGHPGTPILYDISKPVAEGGMPFRNRFGTEHNGVSQLAGEGSANPGSKIKGGYAEFTDSSFDALGIPLTDNERKIIKGYNWKTDISGTIIRKALEHGLAPLGNARARAIVWGWLDPIPVHREPLHTPRPDLIPTYPTYEDQQHHYRLTTRFKSEQNPDLVKSYPLMVTTGRIVEYMGGGEESRSNKYLAELQPVMFAEINQKTAVDYHLQKGDMIWIESPNGGKIKVKIKITARVGPDLIFLPYHFGGEIEGKSRKAFYPEGTAPYVLGAPANVVTNYGYDIITQMQETKTGLCRIRKA
jgi:formate dehydrogenase major subunit